MAKAQQHATQEPVLKASELIERLQEAIRVHGDLPTGVLYRRSFEGVTRVENRAVEADEGDDPALGPRFLRLA